jgi:hypothetical protein
MSFPCIAILLALKGDFEFLHPSPHLFNRLLDLVFKKTSNQVAGVVVTI